MATGTTTILNVGQKSTDTFKFVVGGGAPIITDDLITDTNQYNIGTVYLDTTNFVVYYRVAVNGALADFVYSATMTAL